MTYDFDALIAKHSQTEAGKKLRELLLKISDDKEFVYGIGF